MSINLRLNSLVVERFEIYKLCFFFTFFSNTKANNFMHFSFKAYSKLTDISTKKRKSE